MKWLYAVLIGVTIMHVGSFVHVRPDLVGKVKFEAGQVLYTDGPRAYIQDHHTLAGYLVPKNILIGDEGRDENDDEDQDDGDYEEEVA